MCIYGQRDLSVMDFWRDKYVTCVCPPKVSWSYRCMTKVLCHLFLKLLAAASKNVSLKNSRRWSVDRHWRILSRIFENSREQKEGHLTHVWKPPYESLFWAGNEPSGCQRLLGAEKEYENEVRLRHRFSWAFLTELSNYFLTYFWLFFASRSQVQTQFVFFYVCLVIWSL